MDVFSSKLQKYDGERASQSALNKLRALLHVKKAYQARKLRWVARNRIAECIQKTWRPLKSIDEGRRKTIGRNKESSCIWNFATN